MSITSPSLNPVPALSHNVTIGELMAMSTDELRRRFEAISEERQRDAMWMYIMMEQERKAGKTFPSPEFTAAKKAHDAEIEKLQTRMDEFRERFMARLPKDLRDAFDSLLILHCLAEGRSRLNDVNRQFVKEVIDILSKALPRMGQKATLKARPRARARA